MNDEFVNWDVHATNDPLSSQIENDDPLTQFSETESQYYPSYIPVSHESKKNTVLPPIIPSSSPILDSSDSYSNSSSLSVTPPLQTKGMTSSSSPSSKAPEAEEIPVIPMTILISDPQKHQDSTQGSFITYLLTTSTEIDTYRSVNSRPVRRRYQDFKWLHTVLSLEYPACIIPPLPEKHRLEYIKGDRFSTEFIQKRQISLQWFLNRISRHPILQKSQCTQVFLESTDFKNDKRAYVLAVTPNTSIFDSISDTLVNAFAKIKKPDERFEILKESTSKLQENLTIVERLYNRINKRQHDVQNDYIQLSNSIQMLASIETTIASTLNQFSETTRAYSQAMQEMITKEEMQFLNEIHELLAYCSAAKDVLKSRDQKQLDFEGLSVYLNQTMLLKEHTKYPGKKMNNQGSGMNGLYITDYITDKLKEVSGVNMVKARSEKLAKLERRLIELQEEVTRANDESKAFSNQVLIEFENFQKTKVLELRQGLLSYAECHIEFYEKGVTIWEQILPVLENAADISDLAPTI